MEEERKIRKKPILPILIISDESGAFTISMAREIFLEMSRKKPVEYVCGNLYPQYPEKPPVFDAPKTDLLKPIETYKDGKELRRERRKQKRKKY